MALRQECSFIFALWLGIGSPALAQQPLRWTDVVRESGPGLPELQLIRETADVLATASPTFAEMLVIVKSAPRLIMFVRPSTVADALGRTQFYVTAGRTFGVMDINSYRPQPLLRIRAIAHELAHAVEIACIPSQRETSELRAILVARARQNPGKGPATETRFAAVLERLVLNEYQRVVDARVERSGLAERQELARCSALSGLQASNVDQRQEAEE